MAEQPHDDAPAVRGELIAEAEIDRRVAELAERISADYDGLEDELVLVGVLKGAFIFLADLSRRLTVPRRVEFMALSSYRGGARAGDVRLILDLRTRIRDRHVLIVEDIVDSGRTLDYLKDLLRARGPASVRACALVRKAGAAETAVEVEYLGFEIPDEWVVGYGLDYGEHHRTLPYIGVVEPPGGDGTGDSASA